MNLFGVVLEKKQISLNNPKAKAQQNFERSR